ncbi:MAG: PASTA domain-containing protein, partial [Oscillospiraceae bacterium]|nr:PASTA domain-containing protein [Oscillospiraceae bacterium]
FIPVMTAVTIAFIVVAVFFILWLVKDVINDPQQSTKYEMPNLVGMDYYEAKDSYTYLDIQINETENSTYEKDVIYFQDIAVGDTISTGQTVYVNVSLGISMIEVPNVKNYHYEMAKKMLEQEGFVIDQKYEISSEGVETSMVIRTEPAAGEEAEAGSTVIMYISKGIENSTIEVQNQVGKTIEEAEMFCDYYGLKVNKIESPSTEDENIVIAQSIEPGQIVEPGTEITLTYSNGQDPTGVVTFALTLPENATGRFVLDFIDSNGTTIASSSIINAAFSGSSVNIPVESTGVQQIFVSLSNYATNQQEELGVYNFDFTNQNYSAVRENVKGAFEAVGGINYPTEPVTEIVTVPDPIVEDPQPMTDPIIQTAPDPIVEDPQPEDPTDPPETPENSETPTDADPGNIPTEDAPATAPAA